MAKRRLTRDEFFSRKGNRETIAIALNMHRRLRMDIGNVPWSDAALEMLEICEILGISENELSEATKGMEMLRIVQKE